LTIGHQESRSAQEEFWEAGQPGLSKLDPVKTDNTTLGGDPQESIRTLRHPHNAVIWQAIFSQPRPRKIGLIYGVWFGHRL
jgi:hypothetical protein